MTNVQILVSGLLVTLQNIWHIETGITPSEWKSIDVTPLLKDGDGSNPNNYRPISKLSVLAKVLSRTFR